MKKIYVMLLCAVLSATWLGAQEPGETIAQPKDVHGRRINAAGEITHEYEASFSYGSDGKLAGFQFPEWGVTSNFNYEGDFLTSVLTQHNGMWPYYSDALRYTYEEGRIKTETHEWDAMNDNEHYEYEYYEDGRLLKKTYAGGALSDPYAYSTFEYDDGGKTRTESYFGKAFVGVDLVWRLGYRTVWQYDDGYALLSEQTDKYDEGGEITVSKRKLYTYTANGKPETEVAQTWDGNEWVNGTVHRYVYDEEGRVAEQQDGTWSATLGDWDITAKTVHEYSEENSTYTVSFLKKSGDNWERDIFNGQRIFFESVLYRQQNAMNCFVYEDLLGSAQVNQFEFDLIHTKNPSYMVVEGQGDAFCAVYPNPGREGMTVKAPVENAVVRLYDMQGRLLLAKPFDFQADINTATWAPGVYLWEIWNGPQKEASGKWVKQ